MYLPYLITQKGIETPTATVPTEQNVSLPDVIGEEEQPKSSEKTKEKESS